MVKQRWQSQQGGKQRLVGFGIERKTNKGKIILLQFVINGLSYQLKSDGE